LELIELKSNIRTTTGNGPARSLRREGQIPAVLYGPKTDPVLLSVDSKELEQVLKESTAAQVILNLIIQNGETSNKTAMIKELQTHPLSRKYLHIDFYEVVMDRKINVKIPVIATGKSKGVELGGILQMVRRELEVFCLPLEIPDAIEIDVTDLDIGDSIHVDEIPLGDNVEFPEDVNFTVLTVVAPKAVEEEEEPEEELEEGEEAAEGEEAEAEDSESKE